MAVDKDLLIVMNTIDETRDHMSEGQYLKTCDALRRVHKKLNSPKVPLPSVNLDSHSSVFTCSLMPSQ
jgi:hypothetical protein